MSAHDDQVEAAAAQPAEGEPEAVSAALLLEGLELSRDEWKRRAEAAEAEVARLRGQFAKAYDAATVAGRVFEDALRWWR